MRRTHNKLDEELGELGEELGVLVAALIPLRSLEASDSDVSVSS